eukprot:CAMPEP_0114561014 /NCGR_PEP_ID=MMETSP0114-20121206/11775_1 /TAXON_ID=31324 /ORGANISM="Goniomonas sp, Strain m" /LENGTH=491 /DNA_ID=CAMNT_0001746615 /DNA_START=1 /DNA_END=1473 /DNA_ORIENTATION=-
MRAGLRPQERLALLKTLKLLKIHVVHIGDQRRKYAISGISTQSAEDYKFDVPGKGKISVAAYFAQNYKALQFPRMAMVSVGNKTPPAMLPMEVCVVLAGQQYKRKLTGAQTQEMIKATCFRPSDREARIMKSLNTATEDNYLKSFGITINKNMPTVRGRVLNPPDLQFQKDVVKPQAGSWNLNRSSLFESGQLSCWGVVDATGFKGDHLVPFLQMLVQTMTNKGMKVSMRPRVTAAANPSPQAVEQAMKESAGQASREAGGRPPQLLLVVLRDKDPVYSHIKLVSDTMLGVPSQCMLAKHAKMPKDQYCANLCLKINSKLGSRNSILTAPFFKHYAEPYMVVGADVTHPAPGSLRPSIAAVVASHDRTATNYACAMRVQPSRQEVITDLEGMMTELLNAFGPYPPRRIIMYRDGVSEGQFSQVIEFELRAMRAACAKYGQGFDPQITFVVVQKRHHIRFFPATRNDADPKNGNCLPGTVIDTTICHPVHYD